MLPLPPLRFSMMTGWPHFACSLSPTMRASTSLVPPLGYGTRNFTDLVGYASCADALSDPGGAIIETMKMKAKAANHRTMGTSSIVRASRADPTCVRAPTIKVISMPRPHRGPRGHAGLAQQTGGEDDAAQLRLHEGRRGS